VDSVCAFRSFRRRPGHKKQVKSTVFQILDGKRLERVAFVGDCWMRQGGFSHGKINAKKNGGLKAMDEKICGACRWHERSGDDWVCVNDKSGFCADWTSYGDSCDEWEGRA